MANTDEAKRQASIFIKQLPTEIQQSIAKRPHDPTPIDTQEISSPAILDMLWANFMATGDERYVKRIITASPWLDSPGVSTEKKIISGAARWSLTANARQHKRVLQICMRERDNQPALKQVLTEIIDRATKPPEQKKKDS